MSERVARPGLKALLLILLAAGGCGRSDAGERVPSRSAAERAPAEGAGAAAADSGGRAATSAVAAPRDTGSGAALPPASAPQDTARRAPTRERVVDNLVPYDTLDNLPYLMLDAHRTDVTGDGAEESVELWVDARRDERGRLMLDDGQRWALVVRTEKRLYRLFDAYVQAGTARFWIVEPEGGGVPVVALLLDEGAGLRVETFRWDPTRRAFTRHTPFDLSGNRVYESPAH